MTEPLLIKSDKLTIFPIEYHNLWSLYKKALSSFWTAEELDLSKDIDDWNKLSDNEKHFIKHVLAFFSSSDTIVNINLAERFIQEVQPLEARFFYNFQESIENIHCVHPHTRIMTDKGYVTIGNVVEQVINVWNGTMFSPVTVKYTGSSTLYKVTLSNGMQLKCTPGHKWLIEVENTVKRIETEDLEPGMLIAKYKTPILRNLDPDNFNIPYQHGAYSSFVTPEYTSRLLTTYRINIKDKDVNAYIDVDVSKLNKHIKYVPIIYSLETRMEWFAGLCDVNHFINKDTDELYMYDVSHDFLRDIQLMLTLSGVQAKVIDNEYSDELPYLSLTAVQVVFLHDRNEWNPRYIDIDYFRHRLQKEIPDDEINLQLSIAEIEYSSGTVVPTFCFNEPLKHTGVFNGILTGQSETYSLLIDTYIKNPNEKTKLFNAITHIPCIKKKADWCFKWIEDQDSPFAQRLIAFAIVEGVFFSGAFCSIYWLKEKGKMPGLCFSNELISRDESLHVEFAVELYSMIKNRLEQDIVHEMMKEAVDIEKNFICESLPCALLGMNSVLMSQYIEYVSDRLLLQLGYEKLYNSRNPFDFMDRISLQNKTNFFEARVAEYSKANISVNPNDHNNIHEFSIDSDF